jgi:hypothetical protein
MEIKTTFIYPPIPIRSFDWQAIDDSTYEAGMPIGHGRTKAEAIADLMEQVECCEDFRPCPICAQCECQHEMGYQCPRDYDPQHHQ